MPFVSRGGGSINDLTDVSVAGFAAGFVLVFDAFGNLSPAAAPPPGAHVHDAADITTGILSNARLYNLGVVSTTDATTTVIATIATSADTAMDLEINAQAHRTGGTAGTANDGAVLTRKVRVKNDSGTVTVGALQSTYTDRDQLWSVDVVPFGASVQVRVTGTINNNIDWSSYIRVFEV